MSRKPDFVAAAVLLLGAASAGIAVPQAAAQLSRAASAPELDWLDREAVEAGEILSRTDRDGGTVTVDTVALIDAPVDSIWSVLTECEIAPEYVPNVVACERIETLDDGRAELFVQTIKPAFFVPRFEHVFRLDYLPPERINVTRVSGPLERMDGSWWLLPQPEGPVLLVHSMEVDPGFPIPRFMLRASMRKELTTIMEAVRHVAEQQAAGALDKEL